MPPVLQFPTRHPPAHQSSPFLPLRGEQLACILESSLLLLRRVMPMRGLNPAVRPLAGVTRHAALVSDTTTAGESAFGMKQRRGVVLVGREPSSAFRAGSEALSMPRMTCVDVVKRAAGVARPAAPIHDASAGERASRKRQLAAPCEMARGSPTRRPGPGVVFLDAKRVKVTRDAAEEVEMAVFAGAVKMSVNTGKERLKKRMAAELDALRDLVKKAEALSGANKRFLAAEPRLVEAPSAKRIEMSRSEIKIKKSIEKEEIDICGGVVSPVAIRVASPRIHVEKASQICSRPSSTSRDKVPAEKRRKTPPPVELIDAPPMSPEEGEIIMLPEEDEQHVNMTIRGASASPRAPVASQACSSPRSTSSSSDTGDSSSSDSDDSASNSSGGSSSDSDSDERVISAPPPPPELEEGEIIIVPEEECIDICGGVSPVTIRDATPLVEVASEARNPMPTASDSGSSSSSDCDSDESRSNSDSESESDSGDIVGNPAPAEVRPRENNSPAQPAENITSTLPPQPQPEPEEGEIIAVPEEEDECIDIGGRVSPVAICDATPLEVTSKACSPTSSASDSGSSSSGDSDSGSDSDESSSDSDSDSESDSGEIGDSSAPTAVPAKENNIPAQPAEIVTSAPLPPPPHPEPPSETEQRTESYELVNSPAPLPVLDKKIINSPGQLPAPASVMVQVTESSKELDGNVPISVLLARAKEAYKIRMQRGNASKL